MKHTTFREELDIGGLESFDKYYSYYTAEVITTDPKVANRIKVKCKSIFGESVFARWVYPLAVTFLPNDLTINTPEIGSKVYLIFEKGTLRSPRYIAYTSKSEVSLQDIIRDFNLPNDFELYFFKKLQDSGLLIKKDLVVLQNKEKIITLCYNFFEVTTNNAGISKSSFNVKGDILRSQLKDILDVVKNLADNVTELQTILNTFMKASNVVSSVIPPYTAILTTTDTALTSNKTVLNVLKTKIDSMVLEVDKNTSESFKND